MGTHFGRQYRAALLDYLLSESESGFERAYELGRRAIDQNVGLLHVVRVHHEALNTILQSMRDRADNFRCIVAAQQFLMEALGPFEITHRGYVHQITGNR